MPAADKRVKMFNLKRVEIMNTLQDFEEFTKSFDATIDAYQIPSRLEQLEELVSEFTELRKAFNETVDDSEAFDIMQKDRREFNKRSHEVRAFLLKNSSHSGASSGLNTTQVNTTISAGTQNHLRLPKVDLPSFDGEITKWLTFKDRFSSMVHDSTEMPEVLKLQYLLSALKGDAAHQFEHMQITADNYYVTWEALLKRYDNSKVLKREYFKAFYSLEKMKTDSTEELARIVNEASRLVRGLERLNEPVDKWDTPLTSLLFYKLDSKTLVAWEQYSVDFKTDEFTNLVEFLEQRVNILKSSAQNICNQYSANSIMVTGRQARRDGRNVALPVQQTNNTFKGYLKCPLCNEQHPLYVCERFERASVINREEIVRKHGLCFNCLRKGHSSRECRSTYVCQQCKRKHHSKLCKIGRLSEVEVVPSTSRLTATAQANCSKKTVILSTAQIIILDVNDQPYKVRALLDNGSQLNFITERVAQELRLKRARVSEQIAGVGGAIMRVAGSVVGTIRSLTTEYTTCLEFLILPKIATDLPSETMDVRGWKLPKDVRLADPTFYERGSIDMLIGADTFVEMIKAKKIKLDHELPTLLETELGWIVSGAYKHNNLNQSMACTIVSQGGENDIASLMNTFFNIEEVQDQNLWNVEERECEDHFQATTRRDENGRYVVRLPLKAERELGESKEVALRRLIGLERRFEREPKVKEAYDAFMQEYITLGHMSVRENENSSDGYYMPHHAVFKQDSTTTKCRVVFDGSSKTSNGRSLNDILKVGPTIQQDTTDILLRWRRRAIAVVGDVEKMYRQVWVHEEDRKFQRILWRSHSSEKIKTYELNTITYGTASAPFLAIRTLNQVLEDNKKKYPLAASRINDFYVDDFISGADSENEAKQLCEETKAALAMGGFPLRKWASNCPHILPSETELDNVQRVIELKSREGAVSTLGLVWNPILDTLGVKISKPETCEIYTKRSIIRTIAKIYDPLGIVDTVKAKAKQFMQRVWSLKRENGDSYGWDEEIPQQIRQEWELFESQLTHLQEVQVPRCVTIVGARNIQIHGFCDASEEGYGACVYVRSTNGEEIVSRLFVSKSKVTPLATKHTIARLELCAAHLLGKLLVKLKRATEDPYETFCWTDSSTVIYWLKSSPSRWKTFVANRVSQIQNATKEFEWRHVPGIHNPADAVSRGRNPAEVVEDKLWWHGPDWLNKDPEHWPKNIESGNTCETAKEEKQTKTTLTCMVKEESFINKLCERVGSFTKLKRIVAYCHRFFDRKRIHRKSYFELRELKRAEKTIIRLVQNEVYATEYECIKQGQQVVRKSPLRAIRPILDKDNVMRVGGRLSNADIKDEQKHPVIIPGKHRIAELIADKYHKILRHAGAQLMINTMQLRFWIVGARNVAKRTVFNCVKCTRCRPKLIQQPMADLPEQRVRQARPFSISGVDYAGPIMVKGTHRRAVPTKGYISIFVCFVTKAVHIELVSNLSSSAFLAALRRFVARRGHVTELHSDNGTNFRGANNKLRELYKLLNSDTHQDEVVGWCAERDMKWKFTPPAAPHFGGLWEAAVKSMKFHLKRVLGTGHLTFEDLSTLLAEIEACLNSRPITAISEDPNDMEALTPGHFLVGNHLQTVPEVDIADVPTNRLNHWRLIQKHMQHIWNRWHREYLSTLQKRAKWNKNAISIEPGRLVILQEDNVAVSKWPMARVVDLHPGKDGVTRVVTLKCANGKEIRRPIHRIAPLPIES